MSELELLLASGDVRGAAALTARRLEENPADAEALIAGARLAMLNRSYAQAAELLRKAEGAGSREAALWGAILAEASGDRTAIRQLETVCATARRPEPFFVLGRALNQRKQFDRAVARLEKATRLQPEHALAHFQLAYALMELGHLARGMKHVERCLRLNPLYVPAYLVMARMFLRNGQPAEARYLLEQGVKLLPGDADLARELAGLPAAS
jgi:tetratricopeptide (TPR) repeat protein